MLPPHFSHTAKAGFSLVEIALAVGVIAFALLAIVGLLGTGVSSNALSVEETRAAAILTMMEADLRNSYVSDGTGSGGPTSAIYKISTPYALDPATSERIFNPNLKKNTLYTTGLDDAEQPIGNTAGAGARFQCSVIYTIPPTGSLAPVTARLIVNWPGVPVNPGDTDEKVKIARLTDRKKVRGYVESITSFRAP